MNYLQLVNDFLTESSLSDPVGAIGSDNYEGRKSALWVKDSWIEIQRARRWKFRWAEGSFSMVVNQGVYTLADLTLTSGVAFVNSEFFLVDTLGKRHPLTQKSPSEIKSKNRISTESGTPRFIAEKLNGDLEFYPKPDTTFSIEYEYYVAPVTLTTDLDVPSMPPEYHKAITWKALENYAREEGAEWRGLYQTALRNYSGIYTELVNTQLPPLHKGGSPLKS